MLTSFRLPFYFDPIRLQTDLAKIQPDEWVAHFNKSVYEGDWSGVALRSVDGDARRITPEPIGSDAYRDTEVLARCSYFREVLATFQCPLVSVRLLRLKARSSIAEHRDNRLGYEDGEVRLHIPIVTNQNVAFYVAGERVPMRPGECWYTNVNLPHRVDNTSDTDRIHLVIDCVVNDWLSDIFPAEAKEKARAPKFRQSSAETRERFEHFRQLVLQDVELQAPLKDISDREWFVSRLVEMGEERGYDFAVQDVDAVMQQNRIAWFQRWIV